MNKIILIDEKEKKFEEFDDYTSLFKFLKSNNKIIERIDDNEIYCKDGTIYKYYVLEQGDKAEFINSVQKYRDHLRVIIKELSEEGIKIDKNELKNLAEIFEFLEEK